MLTGYHAVKLLHRRKACGSLTYKNYGNLGLISRTRGELDLAEEMQRKALQINEQHCSQEGMANQYGNLGHISRTRWELDQSREFWEQTKSLFEQIGMKPEIELVQGWLATLDDEESAQESGE